VKRSEINATIREADVFISSHGFRLPPFAYWSPAEWAALVTESPEIVERRLGWDITDFGQGNYPSLGLCLFTIRNGTVQALRSGLGKCYAEKVMVVGPEQVTPLHFHWQKTEDIINRGGGRLVVQLYESTEDEELSPDDVTVSVDGRLVTVEAGGFVELEPGESVSLPARLYHQFWGAGRRVLVGEVSSVNDDATDNRFYQPVGRFPEIEEDEAPLYLLVGDYDRYLGGA
jgi:D-lyxose ketol-isomerase